MKELLKKIFDPTFFRFILVGIVNTLVGYGVMFGLYNLAGLYTWGEVGEWVSSAANYIVGSVVSFFLNKHFTFRGWGRPSIRAQYHRLLVAGLRSSPASHGLAAGRYGS